MTLLEKTFELFVTYIIIRGVVSPFITKIFKKRVLHPLIRLFKTRLIRSERDVAIWFHARNRAMEHGHKFKDIYLCNDGACRKF